MDAADQEKIEASKNELHNLLDKPQLQGIPVSPEWSGRVGGSAGRGPLGAGGGKHCWRWGAGGVWMQRGCGSQPPSRGSLAVAALDRALPSLLGRS